MSLLISGIVISIGLIVYFSYCEIKASVFTRLAFEDKESVNLNNVKFKKFYP